MFLNETRKKTTFLLLAAIFLVSIVTGCGGIKNKPTAPTSSDQNTNPISRIGEEILQYPGENEEYKYDVYETYIDIREYLGNETDVIVPKTIDNLPVKVVGGFSFENGIKNITLPEGIVVISNSAFDNCAVLETINIPETVTKIGSRAFFDCTSLKSLTIPKNVINIGTHAFGVGSGKYGGYSSIDTFVVKFNKGTVAAQYVAGKEIKFEIIDE